MGPHGNQSRNERFYPARSALDPTVGVDAPDPSNWPEGLFEPPALPPRLEEALPSSTTKRSTETLDVGTSKVQRIASLTFDNVCDFRVAAVTTKSDCEVPARSTRMSVNSCLQRLWRSLRLYEAEFPYEEEVAGMMKRCFPRRTLMCSTRFPRRVSLRKHFPKPFLPVGSR